MKNVEDLYPLSPLQENLLAHALAVPGSHVGFEQKSVRLKGDVDPEALKAAWQRVVDRHPILRTSFVHQGVERPLQVVRRRCRVPITVQDWRSVPEEERAERLLRFLREDRERGFDLGRAPLLRVALLRLGEASHQLVWSYHHLILDAWCRNLTLREVLGAYAGMVSGERRQLPPVVPFRDYIAWLAERDRGEANRFWRRYLAPPLAPSHPRLAPPPPDAAAGGEAGVTLSAAASDALAVFCRRHRITLNTVVLGAWGILLHRLGGSRDVVFAQTVSGRPPELAGIEAMLGMFVNNLPVRAGIEPETLAIGWFQAFQRQLAELRRFEWCSPAAIEEAAGISSGPRLLDSLVVFQNYPADRPADEAAEGLFEVESYQGGMRTGYPLTLVAAARNRIELHLHSEPGRLSPAAARRLVGHLATLLCELPGQSATTAIGDLPLLSPVERHRRRHETPPRERGGEAGEEEAVEAATGRSLETLLEAAEAGEAGGGTWLLTNEIPGRALAAEVRRQGGRLAVVWEAFEAGEATLRASGEDPTAFEPASGRAVVVDVSGRPALPGVTGELVVSEPGPGTVSPRRVAELSVPDSSGLQRGGSLWRTGLAARERPEGGLELLPAVPGGEPGDPAAEAAAELRRHPEILAGRIDARPKRPVLEVRPVPGDRFDPETLLRRLRRSLPGLPPPILVRDAASRSGVGEGPRDPVELELVQLFERLFGYAPIGIRESFFELGGHSLLAVRLISELKMRFGRELPLESLLGNTTVERLAAALRTPESAEETPLVSLRGGIEGEPPLVCVHPGGGNVLCYVDLAYHLAPELPVWGLQARGRREGEEPLASVEAMAGLYLDALEAQGIGEPYRLLGWSFGGLVAYEMARRLEAAGRRVELLGILDAGVSEGSSEAPDDDRLLLDFIGGELDLEAEELGARSGLEAKLDLVVGRAAEAGLLPPGEEIGLARRLFLLRRACRLAAAGYRPEPYRGRVDLFLARDRPADVAERDRRDPTRGWGRLAAGGVEVRTVPGRHDTLVRRPHVAGLAACLGPLLRPIAEPVR